MLDTLSSIAWERPWFAPYRELGEAVQAGVTVGGSLAQALNAQYGAQCNAQVPQFVPPQAQGAEAYEAFVARTGCVPTRDNLHDFFNGLVWLRFPSLKRRFNALHAREIARHGVTTTRGAARDALTLFDENGALLRAPHTLAEAMQRREWTELFVRQRPLWSEAQLIIVGHALLEKLVHPRKAITAHAWLAPPSWLGSADDAVPAVDPTTRPFAPLPVLGVPLWWPANQSPAFYDDDAVFRPAESLRSTDNARRCRS